MRLSVSFVTVTALSIVVCAVAVYIIIITGKVEDCAEQTGYICTSNNQSNKCVQFCNNVTECDDGSDEIAFNCEDLTTTRIAITSFTSCTGPGPKNLTSSDSISSFENILESNRTEYEESTFSEPGIADIDEKPDECHYSQLPHARFPNGVYCSGELMNGSSVDGIPWQKIDNDSRIISIVNGYLNTSLLLGQNEEETPTEFPSLIHLYMHNNHIENVGPRALCHMDKVCTINMKSSSIRTINQNAFCPMANLTVLILTANNLSLKGYQFRDMPGLEVLFLEENNIEEIEANLLQELESLQMLNLSHNQIRYIHPNAFINNTELVEIDLTGNKLTSLPSSLFQSQTKLIKLLISSNPLTRLQAELFRPLKNLISLNVETYDIKQIGISAFDDMKELDVVFFKRFSYCKYAKTARRCYPTSDALSSASNLLIGQSRIAVWFMGLLTLAGNLSVLANRWSRRRSRSARSEISEILNIFVTNLAAADLLMGIYLAVVAIKDVQFRGTYHLESYKWATSMLCSLTGIFAMISCEVSLSTLTLMSIERYLTIGGPFSQRHNLSVSLARASMIIIWVFAIIIAVAPAVQWEQTMFYGSTGLCFPIHLDDPFPLGWQYTTFIFIGFNSACLIIITVSYSLLFWAIQNTQRNTPLMQKNIELAWRFFLMVFTDVLCWAPIIILKGLVLNGYIVSKETIGLTVIYILPINSAVNPILYTFSTNEVRNAMTSRVRMLLDNFEISQLIPSRRSESSELQGIPRNWFGQRTFLVRTSRRDTDTGTPNVTTGNTEDTELVHSICPLKSAENSVILGNHAT